MCDGIYLVVPFNEKEIVKYVVKNHMEPSYLVKYGSEGPCQPSHIFYVMKSTSHCWPSLSDILSSDN